MALSKIIVKLDVRPDPLGAALFCLRKAMIERQLRGCWDAFWYHEIKDRFFEVGGNPREAAVLIRGLRKNLPRLKYTYFQHLNNGGISYNDPKLAAIKVAFHVSGFSTEDFMSAVDMIVDEFFAENRKKFMESRRR